MLCAYLLNHFPHGEEVSGDAKKVMEIEAKVMVYFILVPFYNFGVSCFSHDGYIRLYKLTFHLL